MTGGSTPLLFLNTVRYLKPSQLLGRVRVLPNYYTTPAQGAARVRERSGLFMPVCLSRESTTDSDRFCFLNREYSLPDIEPWNDPGLPRLWLYNLHYFDYLHTPGAEKHVDRLHSLITGWIKDNPPKKGIAWDPYPTSLRIVNWIKWTLLGNELEMSMQESLAAQARHLRQHLEFHLLGNHIIANAKALIFAGFYFAGEEADEWLNKGLSILKDEVPEQVLSDGGHFERTPMYHSIVLEDLLDLVNLAQSYRPNGVQKSDARVSAVAEKKLLDVEPAWREVSGRMLEWLQAMSHPDGDISFFNDAAIGIAPSPESLCEYAERLGIRGVAPAHTNIVHLEDSGYIRCQRDAVLAIHDVAPLGPDYQPGHAHADTLSFELSLFGQRVFVNSGISTYEEGEERLRQRGTGAHNTVVINGENSSEVWKSFRVARRARPQNLEIVEGDEGVTITCEHDGYRRLRGRPIHRRCWQHSSQKLVVQDEIEGEFKCAVASFHLHPEVVAEQAAGADSLRLILPTGQRAELSVSGGRIELENSTWHPEFGLSIPNRVIRCTFEASKLTCVLHWDVS